MQFSNLFNDDRAVSPVIGVILMVAITVILAAVIGTFVLGLGDQVQNTTPQASFGFDQKTVTYSDDAEDADSSTFDTFETKVVTVSHESGDTLSESNVELTINGNTAYGADNVDDSTDADAETLWAGTSDIKAGSSVTIVFYDSDGPNTNTDFTTTPTMDITGSGFSQTDTALLSEGDSIRVIYDNPDSDETSTLAKTEVQ